MAAYKKTPRRRVVRVYKRARALVKVLTIAGAKGGTGKTTTAVNLAAELAALVGTVELQDLDPQASATLALGRSPATAPLEADVEDVGSGLRLRPGGRALALAGEREVRARLEDGRGSAAALLVVDCPPFLGALSMAALAAADLVLVPLQPTPLALASLTDVAALLRELGRTPRLRAVLVQVNPRRLLTGDVRTRIEEVYPGSLYATEIPEDVKAAEAPGFGQPVGQYAAWSRAAGAYRELAGEVFRDLYSDAGKTLENLRSAEP